MYCNCRWKHEAFYSWQYQKQSFLLSWFNSVYKCMCKLKRSETYAPNIKIDLSVYFPHKVGRIKEEL